jgi:hypothetical protein
MLGVIFEVGRVFFLSIAGFWMFSVEVYNP